MLHSVASELATSDQIDRISNLILSSRCFGCLQTPHILRPPAQSKGPHRCHASPIASYVALRNPKNTNPRTIDNGGDWDGNAELGGG